MSNPYGLKPAQPPTSEDELLRAVLGTFVLTEVLFPSDSQAEFDAQLVKWEKVYEDLRETLR